MNVKGKKKKGGGAKTVSTFYTQQLNSLMSTLHATEPHFIRCIIPNNHKQVKMEIIQVCLSVCTGGSR